MGRKKYKNLLPESLEELKKMPLQEVRELWNCYFSSKEVPIKPLWYKILCEKENITIEKKIYHVYMPILKIQNNLWIQSTVLNIH